MTLTWQQTVIFVTCIGAVVAGHHFLASNEAMVLSVITTIIAAITRSPVGESK